MTTNTPVTSPIWHPNTQMREWSKFDKIIAGKGMYLVCKDGTQLFDAVGSMWCNVWGHSRNELVQAMTIQARKIAHVPLFNLEHEPGVKLGQMLVKIAPRMHRVFYSDNGSSAIEVAAKIAIQYWSNVRVKKKHLISLDNGYHGDTFGAMSLSHIPEFFSRFKNHTIKIEKLISPGSKSMANKDEDTLLQHCYNATEKRLAKGDVAALFMESGAQMAGGVHIYPKGYQAHISKICKKYDTLLVLDEIATGFGRLGHMAQYVPQESRPDIVTFGKMLTGGYMTMGATLATRRIYDAFGGKFSESRHLFHGHTYTGNPIAASVAIENMRLYKKYSLLAHVGKISKTLGKYVPEFESRDIVDHVRHMGLAMGIDLGKKSRTHLSDKSPNYTIFQIAKKHGIYLRTLGNTIALVPPLYASNTDIRKMCNATLATIDELAMR